jgi:predicted RNase H-like HicB family nuclease
LEDISLREFGVKLDQARLPMKFRVVIERDPETGDYAAACQELPGCASAGETELEAEMNIREAIRLYLAVD